MRRARIKQSEQIDLTKEFLEQKYIVERMGIKSIAKNYRYSTEKVKRKLKEFGINLRPLREDLTGKRFGKFTIISFAFMGKKGAAHWNCVCSCGTHKTVRASALKLGLTKTCGCKHLKRYKGLNNRYMSQLKANAKKRGLEFHVTIKDLWNLFIKQKNKCAISGVEISLEKYAKDKPRSTASLDRIDSSRGYSIDNVQWVHRDINNMKWAFPEEKFLNWVKVIYEHQFKN